MNVGFIGCGYVANMYRLTMAEHNELNLLGVFDRERCRSENLARLTGAKAYKSLQEMLDDPALDCVLNLTNPEEHYITTMQCLKAGKHVYTEKPLAMDFQQASELVSFARDNHLMLVSAPCTLMNEVAQTAWKHVRNNSAGPIRLVYAEMEDGMVPRAPHKHWINEAGTAWPSVNEFETGCTIEHAGYVLTWLAAFFGPAECVTSFADIILPDKIPGQKIAPAADFSVALIKFESGVVARMTNGLYARHDHELKFFGDDGVLIVADPRSDRSPILLQKYKTIRRRRFVSPWKKKLKLSQSPESTRIAKYKGSQVRDFCRLVSDMNFAASEGRAPYLSAEFALHVTELTLACQNAGRLSAEGSMPYRMTTKFERIKPLQWAN